MLVSKCPLTSYSSQETEMSVICFNHGIKILSSHLVLIES